MFSQVMQTMEPWYVSKEVYPTKVLLCLKKMPFLLCSPELKVLGELLVSEGDDLVSCGINIGHFL